MPNLTLGEEKKKKTSLTYIGVILDKPDKVQTGTTLVPSKFEIQISQGAKEWESRELADLDGKIARLVRADDANNFL